MTAPRRPSASGAVGALRVALTVAVGAGLVLAAGRDPAAPDLSGSDVGSAPGAAAAGTDLSQTTLVCPGAELGGADEVPDLPLPGTVVAAVPPATVLASAGGGPAAGGRVEVGPLGSREPAKTMTDRGASVRAGYSAPTPLLVRGRSGFAAGVVATQEWRARGSRTRGAGSVPCTRPSADAWLVAGGGAAGRQERLLLSNPGANPVTADVAMLGRDGRVESTAAEDLVVPARGRRTVLLDAVSATERTPVVHVTTSGGELAAALNDTWVDGTDAIGSDDVPASAAPSRAQVIPAVERSARTRVRIAVPGQEEAAVQVRLLTEHGRVPLGRSGTLRIPAGSVREVPLARAQASVVGVEVASDVPVVAGAVTGPGTATGGGAPSHGDDLAWATSSAPVGDLAGTAFPPPGKGGATRTLSLLASQGPVTASVVTVDRAGNRHERTVHVARDSSGTVDLGDVASVWVIPQTGGGALRAGVLTATGAGQRLLTSRPLSRARVLPSDVTVRPLPGS